jgi:thymidylate kinase
MDMPDYALHPQSLLMETTWVCAWFRRILEKAAALSPAERSRAVFVADRSPFSAVFYSRRSGTLLEPVIREHICEVAEEAGVHIVTLHLKVEPELLWRRIQKRLEVEPFRAKYREDKREWMETAQTWYDDFRWDLTIHNGEDPIHVLHDKCLSALAGHSEIVCDILERCCRHLGHTSPLARGESSSSSPSELEEGDCKESDEDEGFGPAECAIAPVHPARTPQKARAAADSVTPLLDCSPADSVLTGSPASVASFSLERE